MLRYIYGDELKNHPELSETMFRDRAAQFKDRLKWDVTVDANGFEKDEYDALNPLYVIWELPDGRHGGSMRFLPTTGRTMVNEHFADLLEGPICSPLIWECTRFCLNKNASGQAAAALMLGGGEIMRGFVVAHFAGVFDARMVRIYRMTGASPEILGSSGAGAARISVGLWSFDEAAQARLAERSGISPRQSAQWFQQCCDQPFPMKLAISA
ncbi:N-acyl-L-homoserine lactone synthetase [Sulfitobacter marinus]|uniref:Acyl-homoserine-lactone synthase n=1 Tax=Sulfitobacter marinus TaxID=394264 RepID=A0A1I6U9N9_9RHOB|nr:acyl-homoserine-lactone synthase [Sulfitobacter marinus]SFS98163.1 N-acyl-L-homoserine lactone synthetase [Sulfitobacter marinus]